MRERAGFGGTATIGTTVDSVGAARSRAIASSRRWASAYAASSSASDICGCRTALAISVTVQLWWSTAARSVTSSIISSGRPSSSGAISGSVSIRRTTS